MPVSIKTGFLNGLLCTTNKRVLGDTLVTNEILLSFARATRCMAIRARRGSCLAARCSGSTRATEFGGDYRWQCYDNRSVHCWKHRCNPLRKPRCCRISCRFTRGRPSGAYADCDSSPDSCQWSDDGLAAVQSRVLALCQWLGSLCLPCIRSGMRSCRWLGGNHRHLTKRDKRGRVLIPRQTGR